MLELESRNVGATNDLIICVHVARSAVGLRVLDLVEVDCSVSLGTLEQNPRSWKAAKTLQDGTDFYL